MGILHKHWASFEVALPLALTDSKKLTCTTSPENTASTHMVMTYLWKTAYLLSGWSLHQRAVAGSLGTTVMHGFVLR